MLEKLVILRTFYFCYCFNDPFCCCGGGGGRRRRSRRSCSC